MIKRYTFFLVLTFFFLTHGFSQQIIYISIENGDDGNDGSSSNPVETLTRGIEIAKSSDSSEVNISMMSGIYELSESIKINSEDFEGKHLNISAYDNDEVIIKGSKKVELNWSEKKNDLYAASMDADFDQLYINGQKKILARYPDYTENEILNGYSADALSDRRIAKWKNPEDGYIHALHVGQWGGMHYVITGKEGNEITYSGGHQNNRPSDMHQKYKFVENIREELDSPGEWFYDKKEKQVLYIPLEDEEINTARVEIVTTPHLIEIRGSETKPIKNIHISNIKFKHTKRTFMEPYEKLMRSDWRIYRGAAILIENAEDCAITNCEFSELGGNAVFISKYGLNIKVKSNHIYNIGASAICVVGDASAIRSGSFQYSEFVEYDEMDKTPGPANALYPRQCSVEDNLIHDIGLVEKQVAGVQVQIAAQLDVRHNTIYKVPRSGINIGDGAFGGHLIEYNDVFETVLETSDHGAFNSWGRDRFWHPDRRVMNELTDNHPELILLDALYTTVIRNNRFQCAHGWDIDLDDGSSNYHIYNNLCLQGGIKLREGFERKVENNIMINNSFHPHVWFKNSGDVFQRNLVMHPYYPIQVNDWGRTVDYNIFVSEEDLQKQKAMGTDRNSRVCGVEFKDYESGDYTITNEDILQETGFENFPMDRFGVYSENLRLEAEEPHFPKPVISQIDSSSSEGEWLGATTKNVEGLGDQSAHGLPDARGVIILEIKPQSILHKSDIEVGDVIRAINGVPINNISQLLKHTEENRWKGSMRVLLYRNQMEIESIVSFR